MAGLKKLLRHNRFSMEILGIMAVAEFIVMQVLDQLTPNISALHVDLLDSQQFQSNQLRMLLDALGYVFI